MNPFGNGASLPCAFIRSRASCERFVSATLAPPVAVNECEEDVVVVLGALGAALAMLHPVGPQLPAKTSRDKIAARKTNAMHRKRRILFIVLDRLLARYYLRFEQKHNEIGSKNSTGLFFDLANQRKT